MRVLCSHVVLRMLERERPYKTQISETFSVFVYHLQIVWPATLFTCIMNALIFPKNFCMPIWGVHFFLRKPLFTCDKLFTA